MPKKTSNAISRPSGDHVGWANVPAQGISVVTCTASPPAAGTTKRAGYAPALPAKATSARSGDTAGSDPPSEWARSDRAPVAASNVNTRGGRFGRMSPTTAIGLTLAPFCADFALEPQAPSTAAAQTKRTRTRVVIARAAR